MNTKQPLDYADRSGLLRVEQPKRTYSYPVMAYSYPVMAYSYPVMAYLVLIAALAFGLGFVMAWVTL